jgi:glutamyl-tRNA(Gln) amidotransferase subunit E
LIKEFGLNRKLSKQVLDSEHSDLFEALAKETRVSPTVIAVTLTETLKALKREGINVEVITDEQFRDLFALVSSGETTKEAIDDVVSWLSKHEGASAKEALESLGLSMISQRELELVIEELIKQNEGFVREKGSDAFGPIMGMVMERVRGRVRAELASELLRRRLKEFVK